jgi:acetyl esterase/lipase
MSRQQIEALKLRLAPPAEPAPFTIQGARDTWYAHAESYIVPTEVAVRQDEIGGVPSEWLSRPGARIDRVALWLHGGGMVCGSARLHRPLTAPLAAAFDGQVVCPDYRLAPEHPFPAAIEDCLAVYRALLDEGVPATGIAVGGDSGGAALALSMMLALGSRGLPRPAAAWLISPWTDIENGGASIAANAKTDPVVFVESLDNCRDAYLGGQPASTPLANPGRADLTGLPPLLIQVASPEILLDDALAVARGAALGGAAVTLEA